MQTIVNAIALVLSKIVASLRWIGELFAKVFQALWDLFQDGVCWTFDGFLSLSINILSAFDFSGLTAYAGQWAGLPSGTIEVLGAVGISQASGIVITAIGIRLMLQLVPFTRLGS
jgi:hypothetical protein